MKRSEVPTPNNERSVMGFRREELTGEMQKERRKENIRYSGPGGEEFFAKYANEHDQNNIARLEREKQMLDRLAETGVTPKAGEFKIYPNEKRARLLIEQVPGISLDRMDDRQSEEFLKIKAEETIFSTADALDKIHKKGIWLVDVNEGSFLIGQRDNTVETYVVDFELALDLDNSTKKTRGEAYGYYLVRDFGLRFDDLKNPRRDFETGVLYPTNEDFKKSEIRLWALVLVKFILGSDGISAEIELAPEEKEEFDKTKKKIAPLLEKEIKGETGDDLTQKNLEDELLHRLEEELLSITLDKKLRAKGVVVSQEVVSFLSRALNLELKNRPSDLSELIEIQSHQFSPGI